MAFKSFAVPEILKNMSLHGKKTNQKTKGFDRVR
jgi:hypothetical protein